MPTVRFSALIIRETGRLIRNQRPMLDYELTNATSPYPLDSVVYQGKIVGKSSRVAALCKGLFVHTLSLKQAIQTALVDIIKTEAGTWPIGEDLSQRQRLLEGSHTTLQSHAEGTFTLCFSKPPKQWHPAKPHRE